MKNVIKKTIKYVEDVLQIDIGIEPVPKQELHNLPIYISNIYKLYRAQLLNVDLLLIEYIDPEGFSIFQLNKHIDLLIESTNKPVVLLMENISSLHRNRLIEKRINFIIPGKQLFLPDFLVDLREVNENRRLKRKTKKLLPSAQLMLLYHILKRNREWQIEEQSFTQLADRLGYTKMAITKAVDNLAVNNLCKVEGTKEKYIRFVKDRKTLWDLALPFFVNPVFKKVYVDKKPEGISLLRSNESALTEYSDMNPPRQKYYAIVRPRFYELQKKGQLKNPNEYEGAYCLELWKYNPQILTGDITGKQIVDPLSLYLSLQYTQDERVENALEMIIEKHIDCINIKRDGRTNTKHI